MCYNCILRDSTKTSESRTRQHHFPSGAQWCMITLKVTEWRLASDASFTNMNIQANHENYQIPRYLSFTDIRDKISSSVKFSSKYVWEQSYFFLFSDWSIVVFENLCSGELEPLRDLFSDLSLQKAERGQVPCWPAHPHFHKRSFNFELETLKVTVNWIKRRVLKSRDSVSFLLSTL